MFNLRGGIYGIYCHKETWKGSHNSGYQTSQYLLVYLAIVILSQMRDVGRRGDVSHCPHLQSLKSELNKQAIVEQLRALRTALVTAPWNSPSLVFMCGFWDQLNATEELHFTLSFGSLPLSHCNVTSLPILILDVDYHGNSRQFQAF